MSSRGLARFGDPDKKGRHNKEQHARRRAKKKLSLRATLEDVHTRRCRFVTLYYCFPFVCFTHWR